MSNDAPLEGRDARWGEIQSKALRVLEAPERFEPRGRLEGRRPVFRVWSYPIGGTWESWTLFLAFAPGDAPLVRRVRWPTPHDRARVDDPIVSLQHGAESLPTIELADLRVAAGDATRLLDEFVALPPPAENALKPSGEGGAVFGLRDLSADDALWLTWWNDGPEAWRAHVRWAEQARRVLDGNPG